MRTGRPVTLPCNPYPIRTMATAHRIGLGDLATACGISCSAMSRVLLHRKWPGHVNVAECKTKLQALLHKHGGTDAEIKAAWDTGLQPDATTPSPSTTTTVNGHSNTNPSVAEDDFHVPEASMLSAEVRGHFSLVADPFHNDINGPSDLFMARDQRYVRESMYYAARNQGFLAVIGEPGSGKSTLRRDLLARMQRENDRIIVIRPSGDIEASELRAPHICDAIIRSVSSETMRSSLEARSRQVDRLLSASSRNSYSHMLLIEEAQDLCKPTLKFLKRLWEKEDGFARLIGIVMIGQSELADLLDEKKNPDLREVIRRVEVAKLRPLDGNLQEYLEFKLKRVGSSVADVFDADAIDALRQRLIRTNTFTKARDSMVYPLIVNNAVALAMKTAFELGLSKIGAELVGRL